MKHTIHLLCLAALISTAACAGPGAPQFTQAKTLDFVSYEQIFSSHSYSCIWYAGTDSTYHYYVMQRWTYTNADKSDGHLDSQDLYKVSVSDINVNHPIPLSNDNDKWVLIWPDRLDQVQ